MKKKIISGITIACKKGDIASQPEVTAVVNAANARLETGGGVAGALHRAAGPGLAREGRPMAPIKPGDAVVTGGHNLPNQYVIHCLGPVYGSDKPEDELLVKCYSNAIQTAEEKKIDSLAFPAISTGAFGYPIEEATHIALSTVLGKVDQLEYLKKIVFVLYSDSDLEVYEKTLNELT